MLIEREIAARRERAQGAVTRILAQPDGDVYGDYQIQSSSNKTYRVAMRGPGLFDNYCSCPDFAVAYAGDLQAHRSSTAQARAAARQSIRAGNVQSDTGNSVAALWRNSGCTFAASALAVASGTGVGPGVLR
jgi:hypothetical protein